ncbi:MAG: glycosyltransferase family 4 protein [Chthonomonadaceae bacterium]|nr:glycosyltransferase family 4 protein [Chthonomonadaceae bacterium]
MKSPERPQSCRILHLISSLQVGGLEQFALRMAHFQRVNGQDAQIITLKDGHLRAEAERLKVPVTLISGGKLKRVISGVTRFRSLAPDIIHAHNTPVLNYALLGKRSSHAPIVLTLHGRGKNDSRSPTPALWKQTDAIVAVSQFVAEDWKEAGKPIQVILNGVQFSEPQRTREDVRKELGIAEVRLLGMVVARMDALKGHETLLKALSLLSDSLPDFTFCFAGDGDKRGEWEALARSLGIAEDRVRFLGFRNDVPDLLAASDFFVLPSYSEGLPLSVLEAMSHGLPLISTNVGGVPEIIQNEKDGLLVAPRNEAALAKALTCLLTNKTLRSRLGNVAKNRVEADFSFERMSQDYSVLYSQLLSNL